LQLCTARGRKAIRDPDAECRNAERSKDAERRKIRDRWFEIFNYVQREEEKRSVIQMPSAGTGTKKDQNMIDPTNQDPESDFRHLPTDDRRTRTGEPTVAIPDKKPEETKRVMYQYTYL
jgi:hypothetical protein